MNLTMNNLENCFNAAAEHNAKYVAILVRVPNAPESEIIINKRENFEAKMDYYRITYDHELSHKVVGDSLKIIGLSFGDSFEEIERELLKETRE